ncbi:hypothetical protein GF325_09910 [Candidatus Bathyarchaeota archaeon]|nr:hypothetical protein [Candidatus Bathyarchaeota archaeon]
MKKKDRVWRALHRESCDRFPVFTSATPQFLAAILGTGSRAPTPRESWQHCIDLHLDVVQAGHPSFYPVRVMELENGDKYVDRMNRTHVIAGYYDEFCEPFALESEAKGDPEEIKDSWDAFEFPDPHDDAWFTGMREITHANRQLQDPLSIWGVINGPLEPTWQLIGDSWTFFFIMARRNEQLAREILDRTCEYCIEAGKAMIEHGADAIRIGDDYALNDGLMVHPERWKSLIYPAHVKLVQGLKKFAGSDYPVILHSDGNITSIIPWLLQGGIDALNPIQPGALDFQEIMEKWGNHFALAGAFDLRFFLEPPVEPTFTRLHEEVERLMGIALAFHGEPTGFCIGPSHQVQPASYPITFTRWVECVHQLNRKIEEIQ